MLSTTLPAGFGGNFFQNHLEENGKNISLVNLKKLIRRNSHKEASIEELEQSNVDSFLATLLKI